MRIPQLITVTTAALLALTAVTACGSDNQSTALNGALGNQVPAKNGGTDGLGGFDGDGKAGGPCPPQGSETPLQPCVGSWRRALSDGTAGPAPGSTTSSHG